MESANDYFLRDILALKKRPLREASRKIYVESALGRPVGIKAYHVILGQQGKDDGYAFRTFIQTSMKVNNLEQSQYILASPFLCVTQEYK